MAGARRIILRSGDIAVRNTPAAGRRVRVRAFVTSDGIGGTGGFGGTVPLCALVPLFVTSDGIGGTDGFGGTVPLRDGRGPAASIRHRTVGRDAALRASWSAAIVPTAPMRMSSSGSPGKLAAAGGRRPVPDATLYQH